MKTKRKQEWCIRNNNNTTEESLNEQINSFKLKSTNSSGIHMQLCSINLMNNKKKMHSKDRLIQDHSHLNISIECLGWKNETIDVFACAVCIFENNFI